MVNKRIYKDSRFEFDTGTGLDRSGKAVKVPGELDIFVPRFDRRREITAGWSMEVSKLQFPVSSDLAVLRRSFPELTGERKKERAITAWYLMRFSGNFSPLASSGEMEKHFLSFAQSLGYVKVISMPKQAQVEVIGWGQWDPTDTEGFLPPGKALIFVRLDGYEPEFQHVDVRADAETRVEFKLKRK